MRGGSQGGYQGRDRRRPRPNTAWNSNAAFWRCSSLQLLEPVHLGTLRRDSPSFRPELAPPKRRGAGGAAPQWNFRGVEGGSADTPLNLGRKSWTPSRARRQSFATFAKM